MGGGGSFYIKDTMLMFRGGTLVFTCRKTPEWREAPSPHQDVQFGKNWFILLLHKNVSYIIPLCYSFVILVTFGGAGSFI